VAYVAGGGAAVLPQLAPHVDARDAAARAAYTRNESIVLAHAARVYNVSGERTARYWRGESAGWERRERVRQTLELVALSDRADHYPNELSGGQQQRVAIARALVNDPLVILADEATGNLDSKSGEEILGIFDDLNNQGVTLVFVTHDERMVERCKRIVRLRDGFLDKDLPGGAARRLATLPS
jgi:predicted ABC-type transport system involved in lysophospholipase L1 biosynthesis ATPase subunit